MASATSERTVSSIHPSDRAGRVLIAAEERLKQQVAELLHGPIQTRLLIASINIGKCLQLLPTNPRRAATLLEAVRQDVNDLREHDVRLAGRLLHPTVLSMGVAPAVRSLARQFHPHFSVHVDVNSDFAALDDLGNAPHGDGWRLACYRIVEECLNNVYFHAQAQKVHVSLHVLSGGNQVQISIHDDGNGFDPTVMTPGLGLQIVAARAAELSGRVTVTSCPAEGTTVTVQWSLSGEK